MAKLPKFLADWRFMLVYVAIAGGIAALVFMGGDVSPIDRYMKGKGGSLGQASGNAVANVPKESYQHMGSISHTNFVWVDKKFTDSKVALRALGAAICAEQKHEDYCEVYFWTDKKEITVTIPINRGNSLIGEFTQKDGRQKWKEM